MDKLDAMALFVAVVQEGGFAAAARRRGVSPPMVTRAVGELETTLGSRLLVRSTRVVKVTEVGARYAQDCLRLLGELEEIEASASGSHQAARGRLVISASVMYGRLKLADVVLDYLRLYPETEVECRYVDRNLNLLNEGVDIAVRIGKLPDSSYHATPLATVRRVVCASPAYLADQGTPTHPRELAGHRLIAATGVEPGLEWTFRDGDASFAAPVKARLATTSNDHAILAAREGFGLVRVLSYMVERELADGTLVEVLADHAPAPLPVQALQRQGLLASRKVRAFLDLAVERLRPASR